MFSFSDLGVHIDGFISIVAHTVVIGASAVNIWFLLPHFVHCLFMLVYPILINQK